MGFNKAVRLCGIVICAWFYLAAGQAQTGTQIDLHSQTRRVDFTNADSTKPLKLGTLLPATCSSGDLFFKADAPSGSNLFGCAASNTWSIQGSASIQLNSDNIRVGTRGSENLTPGPGIVNTLIDNGSNLTLQMSVDSATVETRATQQAGTSLFCKSASNSGAAYTCLMSPTLAAYTTGMVLHWSPDVAGTGGATTLNADGVGARPVKLWDGILDPAPGDIVAGSLYSLWYDGAVFRIQSSPGVTSLPTRPACATALAGRVWLTSGAAGVKDDVSVCAKDAANSYAWRVLY
jgi:hypothetical protein